MIRLLESAAAETAPLRCGDLQVRDSHGVVCQLHLFDVLGLRHYEVITRFVSAHRVQEHYCLLRLQEQLDAFEGLELAAHVDLGDAELVAECF